MDPSAFTSFLQGLLLGIFGLALIGAGIILINVEGFRKFSPKRVFLAGDIVSNTIKALHESNYERGRMMFNPIVVLRIGAILLLSYPVGYLYLALAVYSAALLARYLALKRWVILEFLLANRWGREPRLTPDELDYARKALVSYASIEGV